MGRNIRNVRENKDRGFFPKLIINSENIFLPLEFFIGT
jgi:hypothetical protein